MKKRIIAIILVLMMAVTLLSAAAMADSGIYVSVGGKYFTQANQTINVGGGTATLQYIDYMNFKLILRNVNITGAEKYYSENGVDYYAGILYVADESGMGTMSVELQGNNSITAPKHGDNAVYEGIVSTGRMGIRGDNLTINGVDVGIEAAKTMSTEFTECELSIGNRNLTINATDTDIYCEWLGLGPKYCTLNSTGYNCITTSYRFEASKSSQLNVNLTPDVSKGYANPVAIMCMNSCTMFNYATINVNFDASGYKGKDEITAFGIYAEKGMWADTDRQYVNVNLKSGGNASAVGICCGVLNAQSGNEFPLLSSKVSISGEHPESCAILCTDRASISGKTEAIITGASENDSAFECFGNTSIYTSSFYAQTDCKDSLHGAVYVPGGNLEISKQRPLFTPAGGSVINIGTEEEPEFIVADTDGKPADCVVIGAEGNPFRDIYDQIDAFKTSILWANGLGITTGFTPVEFRPTATCNRGQVVTFLWRAKGSPEPTLTENPFVDVYETSPYYKAILWAVEQGITTGFDATHFKPSNPCTRAQVVTFLWRAMGKPAPESDSNPFADVSAVGSTKPYYEAILWAAEQGITGGYTPTEFRPNTVCTRAQIVTFLYRCFEGQEISRSVKDYRIVFGEEPVVENAPKAKLPSTYGQGEYWDYVPLNIYVTYDITTNVGHRTEEGVYSVYVRQNIQEGSKPSPEECVGKIVGVKDGKLVFEYSYSNTSSSFAILDYKNNTAQGGYATDETYVMGNCVVYFSKDSMGENNIHTMVMSTGRTSSHIYHSYTVRGETIYFVQSYGNQQLMVSMLYGDDMAYKQLQAFDKLAEYGFDETGYYITDNNGTTHYDFP